MKKSLINYYVSIPSGNQTAIITQPSNGAFYFPSAFIPPQFSSVLYFDLSVTSMWRNKFYPVFFQLITEFIRIIGFVTNQSGRLFTQFIERYVSQLYLMWTGRVQGHSQRNTLAVCHHHKLRTLAPLGFADFGPPFLAGIKLPSIKHSLQSMHLFLSNLFIKTRQIFNQIPFPSQSFNLRQQVLGLGYLSGKSFHRAPVLKTHKIPSKTSRLFFQGRPWLFNFGSSGFIDFHCLSVKYIVLLIDITSYEYLSAIIDYKDL